MQYTKEQLANILEQHRLWLETYGQKGSRANLSGANLSRANLFRALLSSADLSGASLSCADLSGASLSDADLSSARLSGAWLSRADLSGADLSGADLSDAYLSRANLSGANLSGASLSDTDLYSARLSRAIDLLVFRGPKHLMWFQPSTRLVGAGCEVHPISHWLEHVSVIGQKHKYTPSEIAQYQKQLTTWNESTTITEEDLK